MEYTLLETAFAALMHDIGKFYQRTKIRSDLNEEERLLTPIAKQGAYHTHLHSGYTSRFLREYLKLYNKYGYYSQQGNERAREKHDVRISLLILHRVVSFLQL